MERLTKEQREQQIMAMNKTFKGAPAIAAHVYMSALATAPEHVAIPSWATELRADQKSVLQDKREIERASRNSSENNMSQLDGEIARICAQIDSGEYFLALERGKAEFRAWLANASPEDIQLRLDILSTV